MLPSEPNSNQPLRLWLAIPWLLGLLVWFVQHSRVDELGVTLAVALLVVILMSAFVVMGSGLLARLEQRRSAPTPPAVSEPAIIKRQYPLKWLFVGMLLASLAWRGLVSIGPERVAALALSVLFVAGSFTISMFFVVRAIRRCAHRWTSHKPHPVKLPAS